MPTRLDTTVFVTEKTSARMGPRKCLSNNVFLSMSTRRWLVWAYRGSAAITLAISAITPVIER